MKKIILCIMFMILCACQCRHEWAEATCTQPKTCLKCDKMDGQPRGHSYVRDEENFGGRYNICIYCNEYEPNVFCPQCDWSMHTTGVGVDGITCPKCGCKVL